MRTLALLTLLAATPVIAASQQLSNESRARQLAATFSKHKEIVRDKRGIRIVKYKDVRSEPAILANITEYAGTYRVADLDYEITIRIDSNGTIQAGGRTFELRDAKIEGGLLRATKAYRNGALERFEGVFLRRTVRDDPNDPGITTLGLGVVLTTPVEFAGNTYDKLFYQLQE